MSDFLKNRYFLINLSLFVIFNVGLYLFISFNHSRIPLHIINYFYSSHHYLPDPRLSDQPFSLFSGLAQYDAQWYLKIAKDGYSYSPDQKISLILKNQFGNLTYAFLPLFPIIIRLFAQLIPNLEIAAFVASNIILLVSFSSLYFFVSKYYSHPIATKTVWIFFASPFAIFYRSYYTEGLLLTLSVWFIYFLSHKDFIKSAIFLSLLNITKGRLFPLNFLFLYFLIRQYLNRKITLTRSIMSLMIAGLPLATWFVFNYLSTGNPFYFTHVIGAWEPAPPLLSLFRNLLMIINFAYLPFHSFHHSQLDIITLIFSLTILFISRKHLSKELWWFSALISIFPLLTIDTMSYSRYQTLCFPLYIFIAGKISSRAFMVIFSLSTTLLYITSLFFVNWYWVG